MSTHRIANPEGASANTQSEREMRQMEAEEAADRSTIWDLLADDARRGSVKDPKNRNIKGRADKVDLGSRIDKPADALEDRARVATQNKDDDAGVREAASHDRGASGAIASASDALGGLRSLLKKKKELVDERTLV